MIWVLPGLPLIAALILGIVGRRVPRPQLVTLAIGAEVVLLVFALWASVQQPIGTQTWTTVLTVSVAVSGIGRLMVVLIPAVATPVVLYAARSQQDNGGLPRLLALLVAFTGAMELLVVADDFLTLLVGWELVGACSWALIAHEWHDMEAPRAATVAYLTTRAGDIGLYLATAAAFAGLGSLRFRELVRLDDPLVHVVAAGVLVASAAKSAQLPFSPWLYRAMKGPTPASALLHSATMVAAGAYALARLAPLLVRAAWLAPAVLWLGLATAIAGGLAALVQTDLKKALAASTSAQYGLMFIAIGAGSSAVAALHLVTHAFFKALLFLGAGLALHVTGSLDLRSLRLGAVLPRTALLFWIAALALAGVPPLGGAYSKEQVFGSAQGAGVLPLVLALAAGALSAMYAGRLALLAYATRGGEASIPRHVHEGRAALLPLGLLAGATIALSALWIPGISRSLAQIVGGAPTPLHIPTLTAAFALLTLAGAWLAWERRRGTLYTLGLPPAAQTFIAEWFGLGSLARALVRRPMPKVAGALAAFDSGVLDAGLRRLVREPILALSGHLAVFDGTVVDAGVRAAVGIGQAMSRASARWLERAADGIIQASALGAIVVARISRIADDAGIDALVERLARAIGLVGLRSRRLQSGMAHHYYVVFAAGSLMAIAAASWPVWR